MASPNAFVDIYFFAKDCLQSFHQNLVNVNKNYKKKQKQKYYCLFIKLQGVQAIAQMDLVLEKHRHLLIKVSISFIKSIILKITEFYSI